MSPPARFSRWLKKTIKGKKMEAIMFMLFWLVGASIHTFYDLKVKPVIQRKKDDWGENFN